MIQRNIIIFEFNSLYQILNEINDYLMFNIMNQNQKNTAKKERLVSVQGAAAYNNPLTRNIVETARHLLQTRRMSRTICGR